MLLFRGASQLATHESMISSCRRCSSASSAAWAKNCLSGGFTSDGLRLWALLSNFGQESFEQLKSQEIRKRRRLLGDDESQPYVDLFSKRISDESNDYLKTVPSPSDTIARAFFGSKHFMAERMVLTPIYLLSSTSSTTLPCTFSMNEIFDLESRNEITVGIDFVMASWQRKRSHNDGIRSFTTKSLSWQLYRHKRRHTQQHAICDEWNTITQNVRTIPTRWNGERVDENVYE
jgi:hypothetical protein